MCIINEFIYVLGEYIALHYEEDYFSDNSGFQIKLCGKTNKIRANQEFKKLDKHLQEAMVAHEQGHRYNNEHKQNLNDIPNPFYRLGCLMRGEVDEAELNADKYALNLLGKQKYIYALNEILNTWTTTGVNKNAIAELKLRIINLKQYRGEN